MPNGTKYYLLQITRRGKVMEWRNMKKTRKLHYLLILVSFSLLLAAWKKAVHTKAPPGIGTQTTCGPGFGSSNNKELVHARLIS